MYDFDSVITMWAAKFTTAKLKTFTIKKYEQNRTLLQKVSMRIHYSLI